MSLIERKEKRHLRYDFSAIEIHELSLQMANKTKEQASIKEEKKSVTSQYAAKLNEINATLNKLSNQVSDGYEMRETEMVIEMHKPEQGKKTLTPVNGGTPIVEKMTDYDYDLFSQDSNVTEEENAALNSPVEREKDKPWKDDADSEKIKSMGIFDPNADDPQADKKKNPFKEENMSDGVKEVRQNLRGKKGGKKK